MTAMQSDGYSGLQNYGEPQRLHPFTPIVLVSKAFVQFAFVLVFFFVARDLGDIVFLPVAVAILGQQLLRWWRFTFEITETELLINEGVFVRSRRVVPFNRVQQVNIAADLVSRALGVVALQIETATQSKENIVLEVLSRQDAERLQSLIL